MKPFLSGWGALYTAASAPDQRRRRTFSYPFAALASPTRLHRKRPRAPSASEQPPDAPCDFPAAPPRGKVCSGTKSFTRANAAMWGITWIGFGWGHFGRQKRMMGEMGLSWKGLSVVCCEQCSAVVCHGSNVSFARPFLTAKTERVSFSKTRPA